MTINGRKIAEEVLAELKKEILEKKLKLRLAAILVGDDPEFEKFVQLKEKAAEKIGVEFTTHQFPAEITTEELVKRIKEISAIVDGVLIELPLPEHIDSLEIINQISIEKDVDVLSDKAQAIFYSQDLEAKLPSGSLALGSLASKRVLPPAVEAVRMVFGEHNIDPKEKKIAVFGYGFLVGKPVAYWLGKQGAEVLIIRSKTENPEEISRKADIIISGVGRPGLITKDMVKEGVVIVDFGYGKNTMGKMVGDVDFDSVSSKASLITPVPGGMGPILIAAVLKNLVVLNEK